MSIDGERQLRTQLGAALDQLDPGPLPLNAVIRQGRVVVIRRSVLAAATVLAAAVAAVTVPSLAHHVGQHPYHVTVTSPGKNSDRHLIADGKLTTDINSIRWSVSGLGSVRHFRLQWHIYGVWHVYQGGQYVGDVHGGSWSDSFGLPAFPAGPASLLDLAYHEPDLLALTVRSDVSYVLVSLTNGQTVKLQPVAVLGPKHPGFVAIAVPDETSIAQISAYSATGELGYTAPIGSVRSLPTHFNQNPDGSFEILRWLTPNQSAVPRRASYRIGRGTADGAPWSENIQVSPSGTCLSAPAGVVFCYPATGSDLTGGKAARTLGTSYISQQNIGWQAIVAKPSVSYIVATEGHGREVRVPIYSLLGAKFATIVQTQQNGVTGWIAYSAIGQRLASAAFGS